MDINPDEALARGMLSEDELLRAGQIMAEITQFRARPLDLPALASSPEGKIIFQYKNFAFNQAKFLKDTLKGQLENGDYGGLARDLLILSAIFPMGGEIIADLRSLVTGQKRPTEALDRYFSDLMAVGGFGILSDTIVSAGHGKLAENIVGPTIGTGVETFERAVKVAKGRGTEAEIKFLLRQTGFGRTIANYVFPNSRGDQETFLKTLQEVFDE